MGDRPTGGVHYLPDTGEASPAGWTRPKDLRVSAEHVSADAAFVTIELVLANTGSEAIDVFHYVPGDLATADLDLPKRTSAPAPCASCVTPAEVFPYPVAIRLEPGAEARRTVRICLAAYIATSGQAAAIVWRVPLFGGDVTGRERVTLL